MSEPQCDLLNDCPGRPAAYRVWLDGYCSRSNGECPGHLACVECTAKGREEWWRVKIVRISQLEGARP